MSQQFLNAAGGQAGNMALGALARTALVNAKVRLWKFGFTPTPTTPQADFVAQEADFTGYAAVVIAAWAALGLDQDGQAAFDGVDAFFQATDAVTPNTIGGVWLEDATGHVWQYVIFPIPIPLIAALNFLNVMWTVRVPGPSYIALTA